MPDRQPTIGLGMIVKEITPDTWTNLWPLLGGQIDQLVIVTTQSPNPDQNNNGKEAVDARVTQGVRISTPHFPWVDDFAAARNFAFSHLDTDWLFWIDDDDVVNGAGNVRNVVAEAERKGIGCVHLMYEYRHDNRGKATVVQTRERFMRRDLEWTWKDRVHEYCAAQKPHTVGLDDSVVIVHQTNEPNTERNLHLLQIMEKEDPNNARLLAALGDTYQSMGDFDQATHYTRRAFDRVDNLDVKWTCATELARTYIRQKDYDNAIQWCHVAIDVHPDYSLAYLLLAHIAWFRDQDADRAILFLNDADADGRVEAPLVVHRLPADYTINRWDTEHRVLAEKGLWREALQIVMSALDHMGAAENPRASMYGQWFYFFWYYKERVACENSIHATEALVDHLCRRGDTLRARRMIEEDLPLSIREDKRIIALYNRICEFTAHVFDETRYQEFYDNNHSDPEDADHVMNGIEYEPYRMNVLLERLKARGAKRILDVGCGAGEPAIFLAQNGMLVTGLDINNLSVAEARRRAKQAEKERKIKKGSVEFRTGSLETMGSDDLGKYDAVVMMELIEHLHPSKVPFYFGAAEDMLSPGGAVFATTPGMAVGDIPGVWEEFPRDHVQEFSRQDLERLILDSPSRRQKFPVSLYKIYDPSVSVPGFASWFIEYEWYPEEHNMGENWSKPVVIYAGPGLEEWKPTDPDEKGLGGSETWAAKTAREFRKLGHPVVVYAESTGVWEGVIYRHYSLFSPQTPFLGSPAWLTMVSRQTAMLDERPATEHFWFMAHDVDYGEEMTPARWANIDRYFVLSEWQHRHTLEVYRNDDEENALFMPMPFEWQAKISRFSNGIEPSFFKVPIDEKGWAVERVPHSFIWSSSPDRGLDHLLDQWEDIRDMWPDATLDIYYGWDNVDALMGPARPWLQPFKARIMSLLKQDGITWHGRIGQRQLAQEMLKHQFWLYPSLLPVELGSKPWNETFCITALEAQLAGVFPIFPRYGALPERFYYGAQEDDPNRWLEVLETSDKAEAAVPEFWRNQIATQYNWSTVTQRLWSWAMMESVELDATPA
jgi:SAM-dependent methyltransferase